LRTFPVPPSPTRTSLKVGILVFSFMMSRYSLECRVQRWRWSRGLDGLVTEGALDDGMGVVRERERLKKIGIFGISCRSFSGAIRNQPLTHPWRHRAQNLKLHLHSQDRHRLWSSNVLRVRRLSRTHSRGSVRIDS
jgi:hypothetical protein